MGRRGARMLAFFLPFAVYALSAHRHLMYWDMGEFALVPYLAGIAHPTGFPLYILIGWLWAHVVLIGSIAFRMSILSGACVAGASAFLAAHIDDETDQPWLALACACMFSFGDITWKIATRPDPHAMAILAFAAMMFFLLRWKRNAAPVHIILAGFAFGCGLAVHPILVLSFFGILLLFASEVHRTATRTMLHASGACLVGLLAYLYLPLRSLWYNAHPVDPTRFLGLSPGQPFFDYGDPSSPARLINYLTGAEFDVHGGLAAIGRLSGYLVHGMRFLAYSVNEMTIIGVFVTLVAIGFALKRDALRTSGIMLTAIPCIAFAMNYPGEADPTRYLLPVFFVAVLLVGEAAGALKFPRWSKAVAAIGISLIAGSLVWRNSDLFRQPYDRSAGILVRDILAHTQQNAVIIAPWTYATPLAYSAYIQHRFGARILVAHWLDDVADDVPRWMKRRPIYVLDPESASVPGHTLEVVDRNVGLYRIR